MFSLLGQFCLWLEIFYLRQVLSFLNTDLHLQNAILSFTAPRWSATLVSTKCVSFLLHQLQTRKFLYHSVTHLQIPVISPNSDSLWLQQITIWARSPDAETFGFNFTQLKLKNKSSQATVSSQFSFLYYLLTV